MKFEEDILDSKFVIQSWDNKKIIINKEIYNNSIIITKDDLNPNWNISNVNNIKIEDINILCKSKPELFIIGTGNTSLYPPKDVMALLYNSKIPFEIMSTPAACRTYNLLVNDNRNIAVGLIL